jgi:hypothetical protein
MRCTPAPDNVPRRAGYGRRQIDRHATAQHHRLKPQSIPYGEAWWNQRAVFRGESLFVRERQFSQAQSPGGAIEQGSATSFPMHGSIGVEAADSKRLSRRPRAHRTVAATRRGYVSFLRISSTLPHSVLR